MRLLGLTGGVGMGKSTTGRLLHSHGVEVVDTDVIAHQLVEPGQPALGEIQAHFGADITDENGQLRRNELARRVFGDPAARKALEDILHPRIRRAWNKQIEDWRAAGKKSATVVIPLLYETGSGPEFDAVICVACTAETQRDRLKERGWNEEQLNRRIAAQWPVEKKMDLADYVVWTEGGLDIHEQQVERILATVNARAA